jgi:hypothetical protein
VERAGAVTTAAAPFSLVFAMIIAVMVAVKVVVKCQQRGSESYPQHTPL